MEILIYFGLIIVAYFLIVIIASINIRRKKAEYEKYLRKSKGVRTKRSLNDVARKRVAGFHNKYSTEESIDDITWNDLKMDEVFESINHTFSSAGEEYLYYMLRNPSRNQEDLERLEEKITFFQEEEECKARLQLGLSEIGYAGQYSFYDYIDFLNDLKGKTAKKDILANLCYGIAILLGFVDISLGIVAVVAVLLYQIITYYGKQGLILGYIGCFSYIARMLQMIRDLGRIKGLEKIAEAEIKELKACEKRLLDFKKNSVLLKASSGNATGTGNPLDLLMDYLRMITHIDIIRFFKMKDKLLEELETVWRISAIVGELDAVAAISSYRITCEEYCVPKIGEHLSIENAKYPLLEQAVGNSIVADECVLLTGSNASGKSTFLRTIAVNVVLAQSIHTCTATSYAGPLFRVFSAISLGDDVLLGDSYYMAEIKAIKRIMDALHRGNCKVICFVDEVLRGTNTLERVSASGEILKWLAKKEALCFAATHDLELTELLKDYYHNYHFTEIVEEGDIKFNYQLLEGKATTRNAIRLLQQIGYPREIIDNSNEIASSFLETGEWKSS